MKYIVIRFTQNSSKQENLIIKTIVKTRHYLARKIGGLLNIINLVCEEQDICHHLAYFKK